MATSINGFGSGSSHGNWASRHHCSSSSCPSADKVYHLENQLSTLGQQMSVLVVEMGLAYDWIRNTFGVALINVDSPHYKSVHGPSFEMQAIQKSLVVPIAEAPVTRASHTDGSTSSRSTSTITTGCRREEGRANQADPKSSPATTKKQGVVASISTRGQPTPAEIDPIVIPTYSQTSSSSSSTSTKTGGWIGQTRRSSQKKPFKCPHCPQSFLRPTDRRVHERIHTGEKPYKCRFCTDSFRQFNHRIKHERRRHTVVMPYKCGIADCAKAFATAWEKKTHELIHSGEKPHACEYCDKKFGRSAGLGVHIRTHTGEKPFACEHPNCGEVFHSWDALRTHKLRRHSGSN